MVENSSVTNTVKAATNLNWYIVTLIGIYVVAASAAVSTACLATHSGWPIIILPLMLPNVKFY